MHFICTQKNLVEGLAAMTPLAGRNPQLPILQNILMEVSDGVMHLTCTDLEVGAHMTVTGKAESEGSCAVPARQLLEYAQQLPINYPITVNKEKQGLVVATQGFDARFPIFKPEDFPLLPKLSKGSKIELDGRLFCQALSRTVFAAAKDETRPELFSIFVAADEEELKVAATDSFRLAEYVMSVSENSNFSFLLPVSSASEIVRLFEGVEEITLTTEKNHIVLEGGGFDLSSRLIDGSYPDYRKIIPGDQATKGMVSHDDFIRALKVLGVFIPRESRRVEVKVRPLDDELVLRVEGGESGKGEVKVSFKGEGPDVDVLFNIQYLLDGIQHITGDMCQISFNGVKDPVVFRPKEPAVKYLYIVMPIDV